ncbi:uncharacterized protein PGTG_07292 [Puccinia graminis f. sp. tritici CRL 75-36-700-3]|uniref:Uncharacterized protein n=1 Tax=Puccinia graminis f. sp. tritici (strain CRL 75-36-700-3 / race SCCL) TaxID=418459 RepID=E3K990_PUCGT|nr:uncharacterized protein PGTG_07292 [Puccinia graminis f. sp. tritici CRL 75-36-700-3]EFP81040.2 hypothetical protein PGTG_07292 [Puccinia graminis f. sp. tritici CRL 75-36-700-3]
MVHLRFLLQKHLAHDSKLNLIIFLVLQLVGTALYVPTSVLALRGLRNQIAPKHVTQTKASKDVEDGASKCPTINLTNDGHAKERAALESVRKRLVKHSCLLYLDTVLYTPLIISMLSFKGTTFFNNPTWLILEQIGLHVHTAIIGNIILTLLIQNTFYTTRSTEMVQPYNLGMNKASSSENTFESEKQGKESTLEVKSLI